MRTGAFKYKCKCKFAAVESNASANAQQLNQMQMHLDQMQMHSDQIQMHLDQRYFITMFFVFTSDILLIYLVTTINKNTNQ